MTDLKYLIPWLYTVADRMSGDQVPVEDLAQEGMIAAWRAAYTHDPTKSPLDYWVRQSAKRRMLDIVRRGNWTAPVTPPTKRYVPDTVAAPPDVMREISGSAPDVIEAVEMAYHRGEIYRVLSELPESDREYIYRRFWRGEVFPRGDRRHSRWNRIRPQLKEKLAHLVVV